MIGSASATAGSSAEAERSPLRTRLGPVGSEDRTALLTLLVVAATYAALVTHGTFDFIGTEWLGSNFDHLGRSLLHLGVEVPTNAETMRAGGRDFIYFGPLPALVRIALNAVWPSAFGQWSRLTCFAAAVLAVLAWMRALRVATATAPLRRGPQLLLDLAFGLGTPVVFLVSCAYIYHEAILWALCCSLWAQVHLLALIHSNGSRRRHLLSYSLLGGRALLARVPFGVPHVLVTLFLLAGAALGDRISVRVPALRSLFHPSLTSTLRSGVAVACVTGPLLACVLYYSWYNFERFGPFTFHDYSKVLIYIQQPDLYRRHLEIGTFNPRRVASKLSRYFGASGRVDAKPPWVHFEAGHDTVMGVEGYREWNVSLTAMSPWLIAGALVGLVWLVSARKLFELAIGAFFASQFAVALSYYWVSHRFTSEFLPGLCILFLFALAHRKQIGWPVSRWLRVGALALVIASIPLTLLSTLSWNAEYNWGTPAEYRQALSKLFGAMGNESPR